MGNKNSTTKDNSYKTRGIRVDTTTGSSFRSTLKNNDIVGSKPASTPSFTPQTTPSTKKVFDQDRCDAWFKTYTGQEDDEDFDPYQIGPNGIAKLCDDIGVSLEGVDMLVLAFHLKADTMPIFTKEEWTKGMKILGVDSAEKLKAKMPTLVERLKNPQQFKEFYRYIFMFAKDSEQKCMPLEASGCFCCTIDHD
ncbi:DCN1-like protein 5 [Dissophora ornata]|nr:DCN1-like protein 5 [Dissophora ornata]